MEALTTEPYSIPTASSAKDQPIELIADTIGQLMEFWGFKHIMGRIWTFLLLSPKPLSAPELVEKLNVSTGAVSMALKDLLLWGAIRKVCPPESRKDHFMVEKNIWKLVSRVLSERESRRIEAALDNMEEALNTLQEGLSKRETNPLDARDESEIRYQIQQLEELRRLGNIGKKLLRLLILSAKVDATPLAQFFQKAN